MSTLYAGIDLHSNNSHLAILDQEEKRVFHKRLPNMADVLLAELEPFKDELSEIVVESTFNWYWLVDCLMEQQYNVLLANPAAIQQYKGLKHVDDKHDAFWLAHMARLGIIPQGFIYPKEERPFRDLLRKRGHLVRLRTSVINSLQGIISRNCGCGLSGNKIKRLRENHVAPLLFANEDLALSGEVSKDVIDFLGQQISRIESLVLKKVQLRKPFQYDHRSWASGVISLDPTSQPTTSHIQYPLPMTFSLASRTVARYCIFLAYFFCKSVGSMIKSVLSVTRLAPRVSTLFSR